MKLGYNENLQYSQPWTKKSDTVSYFSTSLKDECDLSDNPKNIWLVRHYPGFQTCDKIHVLEKSNFFIQVRLLVHTRKHMQKLCPTETGLSPPKKTIVFQNIGLLTIQPQTI